MMGNATAPSTANDSRSRSWCRIKTRDDACEPRGARHGEGSLRQIREKIFPALLARPDTSRTRERKAAAVSASPIVSSIVAAPHVHRRGRGDRRLAARRSHQLPRPAGPRTETALTQTDPRRADFCNESEGFGRANDSTNNFGSQIASSADGKRLGRARRRGASARRRPSVEEGRLRSPLPAGRVAADAWLSQACRRRRLGVRNRPRWTPRSAAPSGCTFTGR